MPLAVTGATISPVLLLEHFRRCHEQRLSSLSPRDLHG
jgi:hypothetical protein